MVPGTSNAFGNTDVLPRNCYIYWKQPCIGATVTGNDNFTLPALFDSFHRTEWRGLVQIALKRKRAPKRPLQIRLALD
jgi:hypothetical protein